MPEYRAEMPGQKVAKVEGAPTTKHARTAYLDYLSRNQRISWRDRGEARRMIDVDRWQDEWMNPDIVLDYDMITESDQPKLAVGTAMEYEGEMFEDQEDGAREYFPPRAQPLKGEKLIRAGAPVEQSPEGVLTVRPSMRPSVQTERLTPDVEMEAEAAPPVRRGPPPLIGGSRVEGLAREEGQRIAMIGPERANVTRSPVGGLSRRSGGL